MSAVQIYSASAGSGKTFTLVREYLKILFEKADTGHYHAFANIMAITFTNKATDEMKRRVILSLKKISAGEEIDLLKALRSDLPQVKSFDQLAHHILTNLLKDFSNFNIRTIDSFFQDIIRSFARELKLPLNFEVELKKDDALDFAVDDLISRIGSDEQVTSWLKEYAYSRIQDDKGWNFRQQITDLSQELFDEEIDLEQLKSTAARINEIKKVLSSIIRSWEKSLSEAGQAMLDDIKAHGLPIEAYNKNWIGNIKKAAIAYKGLDVSISNTYRRELLGEKGPLVKSKLKDFNLNEEDYLSQNYRQISETIYQLLIDESRIYFAAKEARNHIYALGVIHQLNENLKKYRAERNLLFIMDAARLISGFIQLDDMPFLFEKIGGRIDYLFIDEFQDTSTTQWNNILPFLLNILASSNAQPAVLLVGDAKQSIYRWRGGDYRLIAGKAAESIRPFESETIKLETNYRSLPEIVNFNNRFFSSVQNLFLNSDIPELEEEFNMAYQHVEQKASKSDPPGMVMVELIAKEDKIWKPAALLRLDDQINQLKKNGYEYHDLSILVKTKKEGIEISRHLQENGIDVMSQETLLLKFDPDVRLITAGLTYIAHPDIPLHYVNFMWQYARNKKIDDVQKSEILSDHKNKRLLAAWLPDLEQSMASLVHLSSYEILEEMLRVLDMRDISNLFLDHFNQLLFDFFRKESPGLEEFLEWWEENKKDLSIVLENGINKISVMTIHKAKGLEFPVVLIPFCDWDIYSYLSKDILWLANEALADGLQLPYRVVKSLGNSIYQQAYENERKGRWMDTINLLYVALTRAQECLYLSLPSEKIAEAFPKRSGQLVLKILSNWQIQTSQPGLAFEAGVMKRPAEIEDQSESTETLEKTSRKVDAQGEIALRSSFESRETRIGNLVHDSLSLMQNLEEDNWEEAISKVAHSEYYNHQELKSASAHLERIVAHPSFCQWMTEATHVWNEQDIWYEGKIHRPDKIIKLKDLIIVLDFKTGERQPHYHQQVKLYEEAVRAVFPGQRIEGYIIYTEDGSMEKVN